MSLPLTILGQPQACSGAESSLWGVSWPKPAPPCFCRSYYELLPSLAPATHSPKPPVSLPSTMQVPRRAATPSAARTTVGRARAARRASSSTRSPAG
eukprot:scaffold65997_cov51-Phaeocystis_antarctica.AAC.1